jgi:hypothetical protein
MVMTYNAMIKISNATNEVIWSLGGFSLIGALARCGGRS